MTQYRYMVVHEGVVEADSERDAEARALFMCDGGGGFAETTAVQVEALERREDTEQ